ncbi:aminotransferase class III-fold pyridoxal phosphate-dependent enzyme [Pseudomonas aeruginosa]|nr:aminotransferase class III-fold pyridoxal phosphate-dependent enzyme [Pseudomonas aeruginosa]
MSKTNESLLKRRQAAVPRGVGQIHPVVAERAENSTVWDVEGREYIDFAGGIAVLNTGHLHPKVIAAVQEQLGKLSHTCFQVLAYEPYIELAEEIAKRVPGDFPKKTLLVTSGSEAVENAVKIARAATGRAGVIAFTGAYHGRTMMTLGLTGKVVPYSAGMGLMPGGIFRALAPCELHGVSEDDSIASIERIFKNDAQPQDIAAIIIEPVQGEGGFYVNSKSFMQRLRALCDQHGILLIADETALPAVAGILEELAGETEPPVVEAFLEVPGEADILDLPAIPAARLHWLPRHQAGIHSRNGERMIEAARQARLPEREVAGGAAQELEDIDIDEEILWELASPESGSFYAWVAGESAAVMAIRRYLVQERGIDKRHLTLMGYWRLGKVFD